MKSKSSKEVLPLKFNKVVYLADSGNIDTENTEIILTATEEKCTVFELANNAIEIADYQVPNDQEEDK